MYSVAEGGYTNATDLADYLVRKGISFRDAHKISGEIVKFAISKNVSLSNLQMFEYKYFSEVINWDVYDAINLEACVANRNVVGEPAKEAVLASIEKGEGFIKEIGNSLNPQIAGKSQGGLCKALHKPPYAKLMIMQSKSLKPCISCV